MFFRRYVSGIYPLLVWADDEEAADRMAAIHAGMLPPFVIVDISGDGSAQRAFQAWLEEHTSERDDA